LLWSKPIINGSLGKLEKSRDKKHRKFHQAIVVINKYGVNEYLRIGKVMARISAIIEPI